MRQRWRDIVRGSRTDAGFTLVELLVTMTLLGVFGAVVISTFAATTDGLNEARWRQQNTGLAQTGMQTVTKSVRAASLIERPSTTPLPPFETATATELTVHTFLGSRPVKLRYSVDGQGRLIERRWLASNPATYPGPYWTFATTFRDRIVIDRVVNTTAEPLFTYYDSTGTALPLGTGLDEPSRLAVRSVGITLQVQSDDANRVRAAEVRQDVHLPNLGSVP